MAKIDMLEALRRSQAPAHPTLTPRKITPPNLDARGTGAKLMAALDLAADTLTIQTEAAKAESSIKPELVRTLKDAAAAWATLHGEMRESINALTNEQYREVLDQLAGVARAVDPPLPPGDRTVERSEPPTNFPPTESARLPSSLRTEEGIKTPGGRAAPLLEFDDE